MHNEFLTTNYIRPLNWFFGAVLFIYSTVILCFLTFGGFDFHIIGIRIKITSLEKPAVIFTSLAFLYIITIPHWRFFKGIYGSARKLTAPVVIILALGLAIRLVYLSYTDFNTRTHDVIGHINYIEHIVINNNLPYRGECWQCFHPPLYYSMAAGVYHIMSFIGVERDNMWVKLQLLSIILFMIFLYYSALLMKHYIRPRYFYMMGAALLVFWPAGVMHSVRIGNDAMLYPVYAAGLYYLVEWHKEGRTRDLYISTILGSATLAIKTNGLVLLGVIGIVILFRLIVGSNRKDTFKKIAVMAVIVSIGASIGLYRTVSEKYAGKKENWLVGNVHQLPPEIYVGNDIGNFLYFDIATFVNKPFTDPWDDDYGRQFFFNFLLKTGLFTENQINLKLNRATALTMSSLLLIFLAFSLYYILTMNKDKFAELGIIFLNALLLLAAAIVFRIKIPAACSNDFRYILPILISLVVVLIKSVENLHQKNYTKIGYAGQAGIWIFIVSSITFLINPSISNQ